MRQGLLLLFSMLVLVMNSQPRKRTPPFSIRGTVGIPRTVSSQMFKTAFNGVYEVSVSGNARMSDNMFVGLGYQNTHFVNNKNFFYNKVYIDPNADPNGKVQGYDTRLDCHGGFLKIGYDYFFPKGFFTFGLNTGFLLCYYRNVRPDVNINNQPFVAQNFSTGYAEPEVSVNFFTDGRLTFSILMGYGIMFKHFDPKAPRFNHFQDIRDRANGAPMSWINIGFGFNIMLGDLK